MNKLEIHIITYNERIMLPFTIAHYKRMFPGKYPGNDDIRIVVHDNYSTDDTVAIAEQEGCIVIPFKTDGMNDTIQSQIKSRAAMESTAEWVLCIDADELCMINAWDLAALTEKGINAVQFEGWNIYDKVKSPWDIQIPRGIQDGGYSKPVLLKTGVFSNVTFAPGAHAVVAAPQPGKKILWSKNEYKLLHYKHWSCDYNVNRSAELGARQSEDNKKKRHSFHFGFSKVMHESFFDTNFAKREVIIDPRIQYPDGVNYMDLGPEAGGEVIVVDKSKLNDTL